MDRYEAIFRRKSVRKYSHEKLSKEELRYVKDSIEHRDEFYPEIDTDVKILEREEIRTAVSGIVLDYGKVDAPYYLVMGTEKREGYLENVGFSMESVVLDLTRRKLGSCWIGANFDKEKVKRSAGLHEDLDPIILMAFGHTEEEKSPWRDNRKDAKRKSIWELTLEGSQEFSKTWKEILDPARMAPSAVNGQPWRVKREGDFLHIYIALKGGLLKRVIDRFADLEKLNHIDAGIFLNHVKIAADHLSKDIEFKTVEGVEQESHRYIISVKEV